MYRKPPRLRLFTTEPAIDPSDGNARTTYEYSGPADSNARSDQYATPDEHAGPTDQYSPANQHTAAHEYASTDEHAASGNPGADIGTATAAARRMSDRVNGALPNDYEGSIPGSVRDDLEQPERSLNRARPAAPQREVAIVEVGPRDGLQNESVQIPTAAKISFVDALTRAGLPVIEATSFVNPKAVPQLSDAPVVMAGIRRAAGVRYPVLVPNVRGLERALAARADAIALFTSATDEFASANVGTSVEGTFDRSTLTHPRENR